MKYVFRISIAAFCAVMLISSCTKEDVNVQDVSNYVEGSLDQIERSCKTGKHGCFEFVWPISLAFPDGTIGEFADQESLKAGISAWKEANPDSEIKPTLVFPLDILDEEGTLFTIQSQDELRDVVRECRDSFGRRGSARKSCVSINYPISIMYPDETTEMFDDRMTLKSALKAWKEANPDAENRPVLVFPINVTVKDTKEVVTVNSKDELKEIKSACRNN